LFCGSSQVLRGSLPLAPQDDGKRAAALRAMD
jgi:hypothetical protein